MTSLEPFANGHSTIHRLDPRHRLLAALFLVLPTALVTTWPPALLALILGVLLLLAARLPLGPAFRRLGGALLFVAMIWLFVPFSVPGEPLLDIGPLTATEPGVALCILISLKASAILITLTALTATMPIHEMGRAMQSLRVPEKLCLLLLFTFRYLHVLRDEHQRQVRAVRARGFRPRTGLHTYRTYAWLVGMILVRGWDRAERVYQAMLSRGFTGRFHSLAMFRSRASDHVFLAVSVLAGAAIIILDFTGVCL